ncbi:MAG: hypothetical protein IJG97_03240 [Bacilli bacterium]|nr:hypothetical protein [Bacilli bacterium]
MEKKRNSQTIIIAVLAVAVLFMSVGFALFAQTLNINGNVQVEPTKWSVHWKTDSYSVDSGSVPIYSGALTTDPQDSTKQIIDTTTSVGLTDTTISFGAKLSKPGDYAKFTINAINDGDFDAKLKAITLSPLSAAQQNYLEYTVTYAGTPYTASATGLNVALPATGTNTVTVTVQVKYVQPEQASQLPTEAQIVNLTAAFDYEQVTA